MNKWFTRYLYGVQNGVENDPKGWVVRAGDDRLQPTPYADYPHPAASPVRLHLVGGAPQVGKLTTTRPEKQARETLANLIGADPDCLRGSQQGCGGDEGLAPEDPRWRSVDCIDPPSLAPEHNKA